MYFGLRDVIDNTVPTPSPNDDRGRLLLLVGLLLAALPPAVGQCPVNTRPVCLARVNVAQTDSCNRTVTFRQLLSNAADCLADSNFVIQIRDGEPDNGPVADGTGEFRYTVTGRNNPGLSGFSCWGRVRLTNTTPPRSEGLPPDTLFLGCDRVTTTQLAALPPGVGRCYRVDGASGSTVPRSLDPALAELLLASGGLPRVASNCGEEVEVCVSERTLEPGAGECGAGTLRRRYFRLRRAAAPNQPATEVTALDSFDLRYLRPGLDSLRGVPATVSHACLPGGAPADNPPPARTDYPFLATPSGPIFLDSTFCNYAVSYTDGPRTPGCGSNFAFVRTFRVLDWCAGGRPRAFRQTVTVGDRRGPVITPPRLGELPATFATNQDCRAVLTTRLPGLAVADACAGGAELLAFVFTNGDTLATPLGPYRVFGDDFDASVTAPLPTGNHLLRYLGRDPCGNQSRLDVPIRVEDRSPPVARCRSGLNVSLGDDGRARLPAASLDAGSGDNCGGLTRGVARVDDREEPIAPPADFVDLDCADRGTLRLVLVVGDASGRTNRCRLDLTVDDKLRPRCTAPPARTVSCDFFGARFSNRIIDDFRADPAAVTPELDAAFGAPQITDNCPGENRTQFLSGGVNDCGAGQLVRVFSARDAGGLFQSERCTQIVTITPRHEYGITFPGDRTVDCAAEAGADQLTLRTTGCDLLAVNSSEDTLYVADAACFIIERTYEVINWCEYRGNRLLDIPRAAAPTGDFTRPVHLRLAANDPTTPADDELRFDRDADPTNGNDLRPVVSNYADRPDRGGFRYVQYVEVADRRAPDIRVTPPQPGLAFTAACRAAVIFDYLVLDNCADPTVEITLDLNAGDRDGDGQLTPADFRADAVVGADRFRPQSPFSVEVNVNNLPIGEHYARFRATDGCGNATLRYVPFYVEDGFAPAPACFASVSTTLQPVLPGGGAAIVWASDFVASPAVGCSPGQITYSVYTEEEARTSGFTPRRGRGQITFDCADVGRDVTVRVYAFAAGRERTNFCATSVSIRAEDGAICEGQRGTITGRVRTLADEPMAGIEVASLGNRLEIVTTDQAGEFSFAALPESVDYTVQPFYDGNSVNGVTTRDILLINAHILRRGRPFTPYQKIAADVNRSGSITVRDLIDIRRVVLRLETEFSGNASWQFLPTDYVFPDPADPFAEAIPEVRNFNQLRGRRRADFLAIKLGDVSGDARPAGATLREDGGRSAEAPLALELRPLDGHREYGLFAGPAPLGGLQCSFTLGPAAATARTGNPRDGHFLHRDADDRYHLSYAPADGRALPTEEPLLILEGIDSRADFRVLAGGREPGLLRAEAYTPDYAERPLSVDGPLPTSTAAAGGSALPPGGRLFPNPAPAGRTTLELDWPVAERLALDVFDPAGRRLGHRTLAVTAGRNQLALGAPLLGNATGALLLRVRGARSGEALTLRLVTGSR